MGKVNELTLMYKTTATDKVQITGVSNAVDVLVKNWSPDIEVRESVYCLHLNRQNEVVNIHEISKGGYSGTVVDTKMVFSAALISGASSIILAHNHPSGTLTPSMADKSLTKKIVKAGDILDIKVFDHIIVTPNGGYFSFAENSML